jgi:hypothetical protein
MISNLVFSQIIRSACVSVSVALCLTFLLITRKKPFLGAFAKLRRATISFVMSVCLSVGLSVCLSVRPSPAWHNSTPTGEFCMKFYIFSIVCAHIPMSYYRVNPLYNIENVMQITKQNQLHNAERLYTLLLLLLLLFIYFRPVPLEMPNMCHAIQNVTLAR